MQTDLLGHDFFVYFDQDAFTRFRSSTIARTAATASSGQSSTPRNRDASSLSSKEGPATAWPLSCRIVHSRVLHTFRNRLSASMCRLLLLQRDERNVKSWHACITSAGPAVLPEEVLKQAASEMLDYEGTGMSSWR